MASSIFGTRNKYTFWFQSNFIVAIAAFWVNFCILGVLRSNAVIFKALVETFDVNREEAAWPYGIFGFFMCVTSALSGFLIHHVSIRWLAIFGSIFAAASVSICSCASQMQHIVLLYGVLQGVGVGMIVPLTHVVLNQNFTKYRAVALGIAYSGSSAGSLVFPPITNFLVSHYGLSGTFLILGGIMLNAVMGAILFRSRTTTTPCKMNIQQAKKVESQPSVISEHQKEIVCNGNSKVSTIFERTRVLEDKLSLDIIKSGATVMSLQSGQSEKKIKCPDLLTNMNMAVEVLMSPSFYMVSLAFAIYFTSSAIFLMVIIDYAVDRGVPVHSGVYLVSAYSIGDLVGRLTFGWIADWQCIQRNTLVRLYLIILGVLTALLPVCSKDVLMAASVVLGVVNGGVIVNHSVLLNEYLGLQKLPIAMGFSACFVGMTTFLRPVVIGFFRDYHESYDMLFVSLGLLKISVATLWFLEMLPFINRRCCTVEKTV